MAENEQLEDQCSADTVPFLSANAPRIYVNAISATLGAYDVLLNLSEQDVDPKAKTVRSEVVAHVRMSHAQAWTLARVLGRLIDTYVEEVGPIYLPAALVDELGLRTEYEAMLKGRKRGKK